MNVNRWPHEVLTVIPGPRQRQHVARRLAQAIIWRHGRLPAVWLDAGGFRVRDADMRANVGGCQALLIPTKGQLLESGIRFDIPLDPRAKGELVPPAEVLEDRRTFLVAHEIGHSFFYYYDARGRFGAGMYRAIPANGWHAASPDAKRAHALEEAFCDAFARYLTGIPSSIMDAAVC